MGSNSYRVASVYVEDKWVSLSKVKIIRYYYYDNKQAVQFEYEGKIYQSYTEYVDLYEQS